MKYPSAQVMQTIFELAVDVAFDQLDPFSFISAIRPIKVSQVLPNPKACPLQFPFSFMPITYHGQG